MSNIKYSLVFDEQVDGPALESCPEQVADFEIEEEDFQDSQMIECGSSGSEAQNLRTSELSEGSIN